jgi:hypothetical protein
MRNKLRLAQQVVYASKAVRIAKASQIGIISTSVLTFLMFAISYYGLQVGNSTMGIEKSAIDAGIAIYENSEEKALRTHLRSTPVESPDAMTGYCGTQYTDFQIGDGVCIDSDEELSSVDGPNNREKYMVYTFYVINSGSRSVDLQGSMTVSNQWKDAIESIRVRIITNGVGVTYARTQTLNGPNPGQPEPITQPFHQPLQVFNHYYERFKPNDVLKVTVVIWYEGEDPDLSNSIKGGGVKFDFKFTVPIIYDN